MKILDARVRTGLNTYGPHTLEILVDDIHRDDKVYDAIEDKGGTTFLSVTDGIVSFFRHKPNDEHGYGGSVFTLKMSDGTERKIKGPWSSNSAWIREVFGVDSVSVSYTTDPETFKRGYTFYAGHITSDKAKEAIEKVGNGWQLIFATSGTKADSDASGEQMAIIEGRTADWYVVRENCPGAYKTEQYLWGPEGRQRWATRRIDVPDPDMCLNANHKYDPEVWKKDLTTP